MTRGSLENIDLGTSIFGDIIQKDCFYVDKTRLIEHFLTAKTTVSLVARHRRLGKSLNMDMLRSFLTHREDFRHLFKGLYIESSPVWVMANSAPVFCFDFKTLSKKEYRRDVVMQVYKHICMNVSPGVLQGYYKSQLDFLIANPETGKNALFFLTEVIFEATGKRSYILIDEYDKLLMDNSGSESYDEMRDFFTALFSAALKGNPYLEKAMLTGVLRISHESMFSGLNNIVTFDVFNDSTYTDDYGFTEQEIEAIGEKSDFDRDKLRQWYNGVRINGKAIYNTYSVMSYFFHKKFDCFWGKSGTMEIISRLLNDNRKATLARLLAGEEVMVPLADRVSLHDIGNYASDQAFYSLLVQGGYLALCRKAEGKTSAAYVAVPNAELVLVWKEFILENLYPHTPQVRTIFDNTEDTDKFARDLEYFIQDRLSFHDLAMTKDEEPKKLQERFYHIFVLGILSAYEDVKCMHPLSNRESGDGRYDIFVEKQNCNFVFELKAFDKDDDLDAGAQTALAQIDSKRYGLDLDAKKRLIKIGVAVSGKKCRVKVQ